MGNKRLKCKHCDETFDEYREVRKHKRHAHPLQPKTLCPVCGKVFHPDYMKTHMYSHTDSYKFKCKICNIPLRDMTHLRSHKAKHDYFFKKCQDCAVTGFTSRRKYETHVRSHNLDQFVCETCGKNYRTKETLLVHQKKHEGVVYRCTLCEKVFNTNSGRLKHKHVVHDGLQHICEVCGAKYTDKHNLTAHLIKHGRSCL